MAVIRFQNILTIKKNLTNDKKHTSEHHYNFYISKKKKFLSQNKNYTILSECQMDKCMNTTQRQGVNKGSDCFTSDLFCAELN